MREKELTNYRLEDYKQRHIPINDRILALYLGNNPGDLKAKAYLRKLKITPANHEPLVNLSSYQILNSSFEYEKLKVSGSSNILPDIQKYLRKDIYVRETVANCLLTVHKELQKNGYSLFVRSGFRHPIIQEAQFASAQDKYGKDFARSRLAAKEDLLGEDSIYPHATGGVVDVEIWKEGKRIEMGEPGVPIGMFDLEILLSQKSGYRNAKENIIQQKLPSISQDLPSHWIKFLENRRLLYHLMRKAGFYFIVGEFWHWGMGDHLSGVAAYLLGDDKYRPYYGQADLPKERH